MQDIPLEERLQVLAAMNRIDATATDQEKIIVVATDIAARGLDFRQA
jgi:superfamily II DNA/RNA helicase